MHYVNKREKNCNLIYYIDLHYFLSPNDLFIHFFFIPTKKIYLNI